MIDYVYLLDSEPIEIAKTCHIRCPTVREVKGIQKTYLTYLNLLSLTKESILNTVDFDSAGYDTGEISIFDIVIAVKELREQIEKALSFFICEDIFYDAKLGMWCVFHENNTTKFIYRDNYEEISRSILEMNYVESKVFNAPKKFRNKKAKEIYEGLQTERKKASKSSKVSATSLGDIISYLSINSNTYNIFNVWNLTIYQLYDQFMRLNLKIQIDTYGQRWAAWGQEPFDFATYYQSLTNKQEEKNE